MDRIQLNRRAFARHFQQFLISVMVLSATQAAPGDVVNLTLDPSSLYGTDPSTGMATLDSVFPQRIRTVSLASSNPSVASVPASVMTTLGRLTVVFPITTSPVAQATNVTITATHDGVSRQAVLTVRPPVLVGIGFNPNPLVGGYNCVVTATINRPAPANWLCSIQGPFPPVYFMTGSIVSFTPGATSTDKTLNTTVVNSEISALITVRPPTGQTPSVSGTLAVVPVRVASITLAPAAVSAGAASLACVTLNAPAAAGGATVLLSSSDPAVAGVPLSLQIPQGDNDGCVLVQSHSVAVCAAATISASFGGQTVQATLAVGSNRRLTDNNANDSVSARNSHVSQGKTIWTNGDDVFYHDGTTTNTAQARGALETIETNVFALGSGVAPGQVVGVWRRGTDFAWVWRNNGQPPVLVTAVNPIDPQDPLNPEAVAVADGAVFLALQTFVNAQSVKHVFRVDPASGQATNLTGSAAVPGAQRVSTSGGQAAWLFDTGSGTSLVQFYDGSSVATVDSAAEIGENVRLSHGRVVYAKRTAGGAWHIFLYDSTSLNPMPTQISLEPAPDLLHMRPVTDGRHVAWLYGAAEGSTPQVMLAGGLPLGSPLVAASSSEQTLQLDRGQVLWTNRLDQLYSYRDGQIESLCLTPASTAVNSWLADGMISWQGVVVGESPQTSDSEIFLHESQAPDDARQPLPPLLVVAAPGDGSASLNWDRILGATSYNVYLAEQGGVTQINYASFPGGRRISGVTTVPTTVTGLVNGRTYHFVVTAVDGASEGGDSMEASATPFPAWRRVATGSFHAVTANTENPSVAYAAGDTTVYRTQNGGESWSPLGGLISGQSTRALTALRLDVFAATTDGKVLRSNNSGDNWAIVASGEGFGESLASIAFDPAAPQRLFAGDIRLTQDTPSLLVTSGNGGDTWDQLPDPQIGELHAYAMAFDLPGDLYVVGSGVPVARSPDGGATWSALDPGIVQILSIALDPATASTLYIGSQNDGVYKSVTAGESWSPAGPGLPTGEPVSALLIDPAAANVIFAGTGAGMYVTTDGGQNWELATQGMGTPPVRGLALSPARRLMAAAADGLYVIDLGLLGDANCDGQTNTLDIAPFVLALTSPAAYQAAFPNCPLSRSDLNQDGRRNGMDIALMAALFTGR